jgi:transposase
MEPMLTHVAGVDVHKEILAITVLIGDLDKEPKKIQFQCKTFSEDLEAAGKRLLELGVKHVAMESTGIYWKPVYNVWHPMGLIITLGNAYHLKNVPGRKTDTKDADWIAQLHRCGLIKASFIPDKEFQQLRLLNRHRNNLVDDITRVKNRVQKILEDGNVKLGSVVSDVFCAAGMAVLGSISDGQTDTATLMSRVYEVGVTRFKKKENMQKALSNCLREDHCFLIKQLMLQYNELNQRLNDLDGELDVRLKKYADLIARLDGIPGVDEITAKSILCEATANMDSFKDDRGFAAWGGVAPGNNESGGKKKDLRPAKETLHLGKP